MACGSCGKKYKPSEPSVFEGKGGTKGVIKSPARLLRESSSLGGERSPPVSSNPVDGKSGPSLKQE